MHVGGDYLIKVGVPSTFFPVRLILVQLNRK
jgi:hypothetical protein